MKKPEELFKEHFEKFRSGLFKASLDHYLETGTLSGSMLLEVRAMFEAHYKQNLNIASVSGKRPVTKLVETAAKKHASEILGIPTKEVLPDDTIVNGFMAGVWWSLSQAACASGGEAQGVSGNGIGATSKPKCYNCKFASSAFKIAGKTHHQCCHLKHKEGIENGTLSPWDTLQEFYNTCEDHEFKK
jgi:hypothetical protein